MSRVPDPKVARLLGHRPRSGWKSVPLAVKILIGLCLLIVIGMPLAKRRGTIDKRAAATQIPRAADSPVSAKAGDLVLEEARILMRTRTVKGTVLNTSSTAYNDVVVSYTLRNAKSQDVGTAIATVPRLGAHERAGFETNSIPNDARVIDLREIVGTPR